MLESQKELFTEKGIRLISVNLDEPPRQQAVRSYYSQQGFTFPVLWNKTAEQNFEIDTAYKVKGTPLTYLVDGEGVIVFGHYGTLNPNELKEALEKLTAR